MMFSWKNKCEFQFHTGSIKSPGSREPLSAIGVDGFNSILVRLKADNGGEAITSYEGFNSILVRLKGLSKLLKDQSGVSCFNSILVRLKETTFRRIT